MGRSIRDSTYENVRDKKDEDSLVVSGKLKSHYRNGNVPEVVFMKWRKRELTASRRKSTNYTLVTQKLRKGMGTGGEGDGEQKGWALLPHNEQSL